MCFEMLKTLVTGAVLGGVPTGVSAPVTLSLDPPVAPPTGSLHQKYNDRFLAMILFLRERQKLFCLNEGLFFWVACAP